MNEQCWSHALSPHASELKLQENYKHAKEWMTISQWTGASDEQKPAATTKIDSLQILKAISLRDHTITVSFRKCAMLYYDLIR